jgi:hypothetical protein
MIKEIENWVIGNCPTSLQKIHQKHINISIYDRDITHLSDEVKSLLAINAEIRISGDVNSILKQISSELKSNDSLSILNDIKDLLLQFKELSGANSFRLLFTTVNTNMCSRFHTDMNDLRLLCTYNGPGTVWLSDSNVNRNALETYGDNETIVKDNSQINYAKTGSVVLLKGAIFPLKGTKAIVHRSPTIEESGISRLLLRIDANDFLNFE